MFNLPSPDSYQYPYHPDMTGPIDEEKYPYEKDGLTRHIDPMDGRIYYVRERRAFAINVNENPDIDKDTKAKK